MKTIQFMIPVAVLFLAFTSVSAAAPEEDESAGTAENVEARPDLSTARSAALAWIDASWNGNAKAAHRVLVDDEGQREFVASILRFSASLRTLEAASVKQFGDAGKSVTGYPNGSANAVAKNLEVKVEGDRATASIRKAKLPLVLRRIHDRWNVDFSEAMRDPSVRAAAKASKAAAMVAEELAEEVRDGSFKSADEVKAAFRERRLAAVKEN